MSFKKKISHILRHHRLPAAVLMVCVFFGVPLILFDEHNFSNPLNFKDIRPSSRPPLPATGKNDLKDGNDLQLMFAVRGGIEPFRSNSDFLAAADSLRSVGKLVYVASRREFEIDKLTHSHPYLTREARQLLIDIGERFYRKQNEKGLRPYKMVVTSMLRTEQSQGSLRRRNHNATASTSTHCYGTTIDIAAQRFVRYDFLGRKTETSRGEYTKLLEKAVKELRQEGRCVVMREYKQACLHITVVGNDDF